jgi:hypothetical protein
MTAVRPAVLDTAVMGRWVKSAFAGYQRLAAVTLIQLARRTCLMTVSRWLRP